MKRVVVAASLATVVAGVAGCAGGAKHTAPSLKTHFGAPRVPPLRTVLRITKNVPCHVGAQRVGPDELRRFKAVTAVQCGEGLRVYAGHGQWRVFVRKVAVSGVAAAQRYFEQPDRPDWPKNGMCTMDLVIVASPTFVDAQGRWLVPKTPVDRCDHPVGLPPGEKKPPKPIEWRVVAVHKIRLQISAPALAAGCDMRMGRPTRHSWTYAPFYGVHPWKVRVCVYRTSARHQWIGNFVRGFRLDRSQTKRLLSVLTGPTRADCAMTAEFAEVFTRHPGVSAGVELGDCYRVNGGPGTADAAVVRSILGSE